LKSNTGLDSTSRFLYDIFSKKMRSRLRGGYDKLHKNSDLQARRKERTLNKLRSISTRLLRNNFARLKEWKNDQSRILKMNAISRLIASQSKKMKYVLNCFESLRRRSKSMEAFAHFLDAYMRRKVSSRIYEFLWLVKSTKHRESNSLIIGSERISRLEKLFLNQKARSFHDMERYVKSRLSFHTRATVLTSLLKHRLESRLRKDAFNRLRIRHFSTTRKERAFWVISERLKYAQSKKIREAFKSITISHLENIGIGGRPLTSMNSLANRTKNRGFGEIIQIARMMKAEANLRYGTSILVLALTLQNLEIKRKGYSIKRITSYSDYIMWRLFERGLHNWSLTHYVGLEREKNIKRTKIAIAATELHTIYKSLHRKDLLASFSFIKKTASLHKTSTNGVEKGLHLFEHILMARSSTLISHAFSTIKLSGFSTRTHAISESKTIFGSVVNKVALERRVRRRHHKMRPLVTVLPEDSENYKDEIYMVLDPILSDGSRNIMNPPLNKRMRQET